TDRDRGAQAGRDGDGAPCGDRAGDGESGDDEHVFGVQVVEVLAGKGRVGAFFLATTHFVADQEPRVGVTAGPGQRVTDGHVVRPLVRIDHPLAQLVDLSRGELAEWLARDLLTNGRLRWW